MIRTNLFLLAVILIVNQSFSLKKSKHSESSKFKSYKGLVMSGYQGWFNTPDDGANRGWNHYNKNKKFEPGNCKIDVWPDVSEYKVTYKTSFKLSDGSPAYVFSSYDKSTVDLHFKWMKDYNIDGAFMQRFVVGLKSKTNFNHNNTVLKNAYDAAEKNGRAIAVMYDLSGCSSEDLERVKSDWKFLVDSIRVTNRGNKQSALYHNNKPLVAIWGVGFNDNRKYKTSDVEKLVDFFKNDEVYGGCSILLGVPAYWRTLEKDAEQNLNLHALLKKIDIIHPWFVGRYKESNYLIFKNIIKGDIEWCKANNIDYVPTIFPGFSWHNMYPEYPQNSTPRNKGQFYWIQIEGAIDAGAEMLYAAMFDEIDEGTAIFKISANPPVGESTFVKLEDGLKSDHYLKLTGKAALLLKKSRVKPGN